MRETKNWKQKKMSNDCIGTTFVWSLMDLSGFKAYSWCDSYLFLTLIPYKSGFHWNFILRTSVYTNYLFLKPEFFVLLQLRFLFTKGQIKPKADWCAVDSPKKRTNEGTNLFCLLFLFFTAFVFGRIYSAQILLSVLSDL